MALVPSALFACCPADMLVHASGQSVSTYTKRRPSYLMSQPSSPGESREGTRLGGLRSNTFSSGLFIGPLVQKHESLPCQVCYSIKAVCFMCSSLLGRVVLPTNPLSVAPSPCKGERFCKAGAQLRLATNRRMGGIQAHPSLCTVPHLAQEDLFNLFHGLFVYAKWPIVMIWTIDTF